MLPTVVLSKLAGRVEHSKKAYSKLLADLNGAQTAKIRCFRSDYRGRMGQIAMAFQQTWEPANASVEGGGYDMGIARLSL